MPNFDVSAPARAQRIERAPADTRFARGLVELGESISTAAQITSGLVKQRASEAATRYAADLREAEAEIFSVPNNVGKWGEQLDAKKRELKAKYRKGFISNHVFDQQTTVRDTESDARYKVKRMETLLEMSEQSFEREIEFTARNFAFAEDLIQGEQELQQIGISVDERVASKFISPTDRDNVVREATETVITRAINMFIANEEFDRADRYLDAYGTDADSKDPNRMDRLSPDQTAIWSEKVEDARRTARKRAREDADTSASSLRAQLNFQRGQNDRELYKLMSLPTEAERREEFERLKNTPAGLSQATMISAETNWIQHGHKFTGRTDQNVLGHLMRVSNVRSEWVGEDDEGNPLVFDTFEEYALHMSGGVMLPDLARVIEAAADDRVRPFLHALQKISEVLVADPNEGGSLLAADLMGQLQQLARSPEGQKMNRRQLFRATLDLLHRVDHDGITQYVFPQAESSWGPVPLDADGWPIVSGLRQQFLERHPWAKEKMTTWEPEQVQEFRQLNDYIQTYNALTEATR